MNKQQFAAYLNKPEDLNQESIEQLEGLVKDFAFCQSAQLLLTLNFFKERNINYDQQLRKTAAYASDRRTLKLLIDDLAEKLEPEKDLPDEYTDTRKDHEEAVRTSPPQPAKEEAATSPVNELNIFTYSVEDSTDLSKEEERILKLKAIIETRLKDIADEKQRRAAGVSSTEKSVHRTERKEDTDEVSNLKKHADLIDQFIKDEPSLKPEKHEFYDPTDSAKRSIVDEENIVSETLAEIYYDQGLYEKSIKIYEKLSLKFPEKSSYFAGQIKKVKEEINKLKKN